MNTVLNVAPAAHDIKSGVKKPEAIAKALNGVLADTYRLTFKTHAYHWNVEGPLFFSLHKLTEAQYENLFAAADELAERIRALGQLAPFSLSEITKSSVIEDAHSAPTAGDMVADLAADHEKVAKRLHAVIEVAEENKDAVTADLATARSAFHEQAAWMLKAIVAQKA